MHSLVVFRHRLVPALPQQVPVHTTLVAGSTSKAFVFIDIYMCVCCDVENFLEGKQRTAEREDTQREERRGEDK